MTTSTANKKRLSAEDWISAAAKVLATEGARAIRVESLAKDLKVTKGSFYWHYANRQELLSAVLNNWRQRATSMVINRLNETSDTPEQRLFQVLELPRHGFLASEAADLEIAIRQWAKNDKLAKQAVSEVDQHRIYFIEQIFLDLDLSVTDAKSYATFCYCQIQGASILSEEISDATYENIKNIINLLLTKNALGK